MTIIPLLCVFTSSAYLYSDSMGQVPYTMLGSWGQMGNRMVTVLPSKSLQSRVNQKSKRQLQSGVQELGSGYLHTQHYGSRSTTSAEDQGGPLGGGDK